MGPVLAVQQHWSATLRWAPGCGHCSCHKLLLATPPLVVTPLRLCCAQLTLGDECRATCPLGAIDPLHVHALGRLDWTPTSPVKTSRIQEAHVLCRHLCIIISSSLVISPFSKLGNLCSVCMPGVLLSPLCLLL